MMLAFTCWGYCRPMQGRPQFVPKIYAAIEAVNSAANELGRWCDLVLFLVSR